MTGRGLKELDEIDAVFDALAHASRRHILIVLNARGGRVAAGDIAASFEHSWPTTSRHLRVLLDAGLVLTELTEHDSVPWNALPGQMTEIGGGEWRLTDRWRLDLGARWERIEFSGRNENSAAINLNQVDPNLVDDNAIMGNGVFTALSRNFDGWGATLLDLALVAEREMPWPLVAPGAPHRR